MIDGSFGEGGGQILRTSLSLSCVTGKSVEVTNIRKARPRPGLQPQHLTAVKSAATISAAKVEGAELSSTAIRFAPSRIAGGEYVFDVSEKQGSAGSTALVLQSVLLPLLFAEHPSRVAVIGGTHVPWSPSFHYIEQVWVPMLARLGARVEVKIEQWGWYPAGGGKIAAKVWPQRAFNPLTINERGKRVRVAGVSAVANLPSHIADRQKKRAIEIFAQRGIDAEIDIVPAPSSGKGSFFFLVAEFENIIAGFDGLGAIGKRAEAVAGEACRDLFAYLDSRGALEPHLADQIVPFLALANGASEFTTTRITQHLLTNIRVVKQFLDVDIQVEGNEGEEGRVNIVGEQRASIHA